jgi:hypothetical protein
MNNPSTVERTGVPVSTTKGGPTATGRPLDILSYVLALLAYIFSVICPEKSSNKGNQYYIGINDSQISSQLLKQLADGYYMRCKAFLAACRPHLARKVRFFCFFSNSSISGQPPPLFRYTHTCILVI